MSDPSLVLKLLQPLYVPAQKAFTRVWRGGRIRVFKLRNKKPPISDAEAQRAYSAENHWTVFEGWTMTASYILAAATKYELPTAFWSASFDLCEGGATEALSGLFSECETREHLIEGDGFTDGHFYHARVTLLVGLISAWDLHRRINYPSTPRKNDVRDFLRKWLPKSKAWGESATPFFVMGALDLESFGEQAVAESFVTSLLGFLLDASGKRDGSRGLPSPYYSPENALSILYGLDQDCREDFIGESYGVPSDGFPRPAASEASP